MIDGPIIDEYVIPKGPHYGGCVIRVDGPSQVRMLRPGARIWDVAPLRQLANHFPKTHRLWKFLCERGVWRPSPRGTRVNLQVTVSAKSLEKVESLQKRDGITKSEVVERAISRVK